MQRNIIRISFFILFFIPSYAGLYFNFTIQKVFKLSQKLREILNFKLTEISSELFNSNHSQYLKNAAFQYCPGRTDSQAVGLYYGQLLINH